MKDLTYNGPYARLRTPSGRVVPKGQTVEVTDKDAKVLKARKGDRVTVHDAGDDTPEAADGEGSDTENEEQ